mgnify:CR=1 FL=1
MLKKPASCSFRREAETERCWLLLTLWCRWPDSNRHALRHLILSQARLPIPSHRQMRSFDYTTAGRIFQVQISRGGTNRSRSGGCSASEHTAAIQPGIPSYTRQSAPASGGTSTPSARRNGIMRRSPAPVSLNQLSRSVQSSNGCRSPQSACVSRRAIAGSAGAPAPHPRPPAQPTRPRAPPCACG